MCIRDRPFSGISFRDKFNVISSCTVTPLIPRLMLKTKMYIWYLKKQHFAVKTCLCGYKKLQNCTAGHAFFFSTEKISG